MRFYNIIRTKLMKKLLTILFVSLLSLVGCNSGSGESGAAHKLMRISLSGKYQTAFELNETFNHDGLVVTAHYSDSISKIVNDYSISTPNMSTIGEKDVTVTYTENEITKTAPYKITVSNPVVPKKLSSISLSGNYPTVFEVGDTFSYLGLVVTAIYDDGSTKNVNDFTVEAPNMSSSGTKSVCVSYTEEDITKTASYNITVNDKVIPTVTLTSITLSGSYKTTFDVGDTFSYTGLKVTAHYSDSSSKEVNSYSVSGPDLSTSGSKTVTVSYSENNVTKTATYSITVNEKEVVLESVFNEPDLGKQVYLNHIGDIYNVWQKYRGKGITIAVIDKAFDPYHEDFVKLDGTSKISSKSAAFSYNNTKVTTNVGISYVNDLSDSHGTFCAGVAAASLNHKGVIGVAPDADLMLLKTDGKPKSIVEAFKYAADNGAKVVTISIGSYYNYEGDLVDDGSDLSTVFNSATKYCVDKGVVVCSAAGNGGQSQPNEYTFPGASSNVIGCGGLAFNESDEIWVGSSYNSSKQYQFVDVFAPSENMYNICNFYRDGKHVLYDGGWEGTSFSSPIVAGMAALYFEKYPNKSASDFETALYNSCHALKYSEIANENQLGYGRVDVARLLGETTSKTVTLKFKTNWSNVYVYAWNSDLSLQKEIAAWPGKAMVYNNGYYTYTINTGDYDSLLFSYKQNNDYIKTINILASSFIEGATYELSNYKMGGLYTGNFIVN